MKPLKLGDKGNYNTLGKSASFRTISRGTYYLTKTVKDPPPPCGYYNVNYHLVETSSPVKSMLLKKSKSRKIKDKAQPPLRNPNLFRKTLGYYEFSKQKPRSPFENLQKIGKPHEKRFNNIDFFPSIVTGIKGSQSPVINFGKTRGRGSASFRLLEASPTKIPIKGSTLLQLPKRGLHVHRMSHGSL